MSVQCDLCPKYCVLASGQRGECHVRVNLGGRLRSLVYGFPCAVHRDPIEKKPLFHFLPGSATLSLATAGCTLHCRYCQNWRISQADPEGTPAQACDPATVVRLAREAGARSVAYTYTDPAAYYEYALDTARQAREAELRNVLVTAAYINAEPWRELLRWADAAVIDLKAMSETFYREVCGGSLQPVLRAIVAAKDAGVWVELVNLLVPGLNDNPSQFWELANWIRRNLGSETPLHISGFSPHYRLTDRPPTPRDTLERARRIARAQGLKYVYLRNVTCPGAQDTVCPNCEATMVERPGGELRVNRVHAGRCADCGTSVPGVWP